MKNRDSMLDKFNKELLKSERNKRQETVIACARKNTDKPQFIKKHM